MSATIFAEQARGGEVALRHQRQLDRTMILFEVASRRIATCVGGEIASVTYGSSAELVEYDAGDVREVVSSLVVILKCGCRHLVEMRGGSAEDSVMHTCREHRPRSYGPCLPDVDLDSLPF
jgi:hypothetical protein